MHYGLRKRVFSRFRKKRSLFRPKKHRLKNHQNFHFFKGVNPRFLSKNKGFLSLLFMQNRSRNSAFWRFRKKRNLFRAKKHRLKNTTKICIFLKGVSPWYLKKNGDFLSLVFMQNRSRKSVFWRIRNKRRLLTAKKHRLKKPPKFAFFQRG